MASLNDSPAPQPSAKVVDRPVLSLLLLVACLPLMGAFLRVCSVLGFEDITDVVPLTILALPILSTGGALYQWFQSSGEAGITETRRSVWIFLVFVAICSSVPAYVIAFIFSLSFVPTRG